METVLTPTKAAEMAGVNVQTIYSWIKRGVQGKKLPAMKQQGRIKIKKEALTQFLQETTQDF